MLQKLCLVKHKKNYIQIEIYCMYIVSFKKHIFIYLAVASRPGVLSPYFAFIAFNSASFLSASIFLNALLA